MKENLTTNFIMEDNERFQFIYAGYYRDIDGNLNANGLYALYAAFHIENEKVEAIEFTLLNYGPDTIHVGFDGIGDTKGPEVIKKLAPRTITTKDKNNDKIKMNTQGIECNHIIIPTLLSTKNPTDYTIFRPQAPISVDMLKNTIVKFLQGPRSEKKVEKTRNDDPEKVLLKPVGLAGASCIESSVFMIQS